MNTALVARTPDIQPQRPWGATCLVIDDSMIDRYLITHAVRELFGNAELIEVATVAEARDVMSACTVDYIFVDRILPDGDGADIALNPPQGTTIVLLSGEDCEDILDQIEERRRVGFLHKDDLSSDRLAALLAPEEPEPVRPTAKVVQLHFPVTRNEAMDRIVAASPIARGLRLLRTVRANKGRAGDGEIAELLREIEDILIQLKRTHLH